MTDDLKERLRPPGRSTISKCFDVDGKDLSNAPLTYERIWLQAGDAEVTWCQHSQDDEDVPYVREDFYSASLARITDLEAKLQRIGRELNLAKYGEPDFAWEIHKNAVAELEARLAAAEAGEDALAEAIRITRERLMDAVHSEFDGVWSAEDFNEQEAEAVSALTAYEARRG